MVGSTTPGVTLEPGTHVWVPDANEAWVSAKVVRADENGPLEVELDAGRGKKSVQADECRLREPTYDDNVEVP